MQVWRTGGKGKQILTAVSSKCTEGISFSRKNQMCLILPPPCDTFQHQAQGKKKKKNNKLSPLSHWLNRMKNSQPKIFQQNWCCCPGHTLMCNWCPFLTPSHSMAEPRALSAALRTPEGFFGCLSLLAGKIKKEGCQFSSEMHINKHKI